MNRITIITLLLVIALAPLAIANTPPQPPHRFFGDVLINDQPAPVGTSITARVGGDIYGSGLVQTQGQYGYDPIFYVEAANGQTFEGRTIAFYVDGELATSYAPYGHGQSTQLALSIEREEQASSGSSGGGGGGGGGGGSSIATSSTTTTNNDDSTNQTTEESTTDDNSEISTEVSQTGECTPDWICSEWTQCVNGFENRRCVDANQCGTEDGRPAQQQTCEIVEEEPETAWYSNILTGAFIGAGGAGSFIWIGILVLIIAALIGAAVYYKKQQ